MKLIDGHTVAEILGISEHQLRVWRMQGRGPMYVKLGRSVRYNMDDLKAWIESRRVAPG